MRIERRGRSISSLEEWKHWAGPKRPDQWVIGRSAYEVAYAWCGRGELGMPKELTAILDSRAETRGLAVDVVFPEHRIRFDRVVGEPRNADLAFIGCGPDRKVAVTIEAKADEPFGANVVRTVNDALERSLKNPRGRGVGRVEALVRALLRPQDKNQLSVGLLRYQLLTAVAGTLAWAKEQDANLAVLVLHEFVTGKTHQSRHASNERDFQAFLERLTGGAVVPPAEGLALHGPIAVPGAPLFENPVPLLIGKITTDRRDERESHA